MASLMASLMIINDVTHDQSRDDVIKSRDVRLLRYLRHVSSGDLRHMAT